MSIVCDLERTNQLNLLPDKDLVDLCPHIEPYQVPKSLNYKGYRHQILIGDQLFLCYDRGESQDWCSSSFPVLIR
ncbi:hypothetical protein VL20_4563 [Microcystis panniformis FACHB-1757]|uniref:Uncharacterized protein n=1 Tax=Microcystis panniformis FACHB-1757 TaxID=1638788 RepID=A0A0K1S646_9CHRO|nr:hypothetical protein VL20_4563 [Microcystis panniformis FACHB-1757]